ncbi:MAG: hypothetical protein LBK99_24180 [Opitutaceae bacterium]|jgi:hypothetical protein|nr:hypothetical protein [Opitutaceae bacterium]
MNSKSTSRVTGGITFTGLLAIVFITLKLVGVIDWSWWWVTAPLWFGPAILLAIAAITALVFVVVGIVCHFIKKHRSKRVNLN